MTHNEYEIICQKILKQTMNYVDTSHIKSYVIDKNAIQSTSGAVYKSAVTAAYPITLVYTPAGSGKSALIKDRVAALELSGVNSNKIAVLNMNIAKVKQMELELPEINVMTFSDFTHNIFTANYSDLNLSDTNSIANELRLHNSDKLTNDFINILSTANPQDKVTLLTLFVNAHTQETLNILKSIKKSEYALESMICQNIIYTMANNPYDFDAILINGVNNMPIPILCSIIEYTNRFHCNLFITGSPDETIYEFNMAYANSMNVLSSDKNINLIRLNQTPKMSDDIKNVLNQTPNAKINQDNVIVKFINTSYDTPVQSLLKPLIDATNPYLKNIFDRHESVLCLARSKADIADIKQVIEENYLQLYPNLQIVDLTTSQYNETNYGYLASINYKTLKLNYPNGITTGQFFYEMYNILTNEIQKNDNPYRKQKLENDLQNLNTFLHDNMTSFKDMNETFQLEDIITLIINIESDIIQSYMNKLKTADTIDISEADVILSTIHSATDIRNNNVLLFMKNMSDKIDNAVYRVALSRANKSEYIIFANYVRFESQYERYIKTHLN